MRHFGCRGGACSRGWGLPHCRLGCHRFGAWRGGGRGGGGKEQARIRGPQLPGRGVWGMEEVSKVVLGEGVEGFVGEEKGFVVDSGFDGEPVEVDEGAARAWCG